MKIKVTQDHIDAASFMRDKMYLAGTDLDDYNCRCPIALAMAQAGFDSPKVGISTIVFKDGDDVRVCSHSPTSSRFIKAFDLGTRRQMKPFSFDLVI